MYPLPVWCLISLTITLCVTVSIYLKCPACVLIDHILASESRYVKLLICLEGSDESKALAHGCKAYLIYDALHKKLLSEIDSETRTTNQRRGSSSVLTQTDQVLHDIITELAIKASSYERHILYLYWLRDKSAESLVFSFLKIQQKGSFLSLVREITSGSPAGRRCARGTVEINTNLEL